MKLLKSAVIAAALTAIASSGALAQAKVKISDLNWTGAKAIGHVIKAVIETRLGGEAAQSANQRAKLSTIWLTISSPWPSEAARVSASFGPLPMTVLWPRLSTISV